MDQWLRGWLREKCLLPFMYGKQIMVTNNPVYVLIVAIQKCMKKDSFRHWLRIGSCFVHIEIGKVYWLKRTTDIDNFIVDY